MSDSENKNIKFNNMERGEAASRGRIVEKREKGQGSHNSSLSPRNSAQLLPQPTKSQDYITLNGFEHNYQIDAFLTRRCGQRFMEVPINGDKLSLEWSGKLKLSNVLTSAVECCNQLETVKNRLAYLTAKNAQVEKAPPGSQPKPNSILLTNLSHRIMTLSREAFVPAHRLCQAVIGLYMTEDFIRDPVNSLLAEESGITYSNNGRIQLPTKISNAKTLRKLKYCVDMASDIYANFDPVTTGSIVLPIPPSASRPARNNQSTGARNRSKSTPAPTGRPNNSSANQVYFQMRETLLMLRIALQDLHTTGVGSIDLLNLLVYINFDEKQKFAEFLTSLSSMKKSDLLEDITTLRRMVDLIPLILEKLSWASCTVYRLSSGCSLSCTPVQSTPDPLDILMTKNVKKKEREENSKAVAFEISQGESQQQQHILKNQIEDDLLNGNVPSSSTSFQEFDYVNDAPHVDQQPKPSTSADRQNNNYSKSSLPYPANIYHKINEIQNKPTHFQQESSQEVRGGSADSNQMPSSPRDARHHKAKISSTKKNSESEGFNLTDAY